MFDYQAGEKFKLTLIMVGVAGLMAGMFFSFLLMPSPEPVARRRSMLDPRSSSNPDITGRSGNYPGAGASGGQAQAAMPSADSAPIVDPYQAKLMIDQFLPLAWDLSAGSSKTSQEQAIGFMTPECAMAYRSNIWTPDLAKQIEDAGLKSTFAPRSVQVSSNLNDGSVVVRVAGAQSLGVAGNQKARQVNLEYLVRNTPQGMRIAGISEGGQSVR